MWSLGILPLRQRFNSVPDPSPHSVGGGLAGLGGGSNMCSGFWGPQIVHFALPFQALPNFLGQFSFISFIMETQSAPFVLRSIHFFEASFFVVAVKPLSS